MQTCPPVIGVSSQTCFLSWAVGRQRPSRGWHLVGTQWLVGRGGLFWGHLPARGMGISSELRTQPLLCFLWPQGDDVVSRWVQVARWKWVWCLFVAVLTWMARRHPQAQPGGSCSQGQARQRDVSQVLSMGLWTQGSLGEKTLACSCRIASMGHLSLRMLLFSGGGGRGAGRAQEPELGGAAAGLSAFAEAALGSKVWGPLVTASWFFHEWGRAKKHLDPAPTTTLPRFP